MSGPRWTFELTPAFITRTARIVKEMRLRVILDLNLITGNPQLAGAWAAIAHAAFPPGSILGFEIGNEPDLPPRVLGVATGGEQFSGSPLPLGSRPTATRRTIAPTRECSGNCPGRAVRRAGAR